MNKKNISQLLHQAADELNDPSMTSCSVADLIRSLRAAADELSVEPINIRIILQDGNDVLGGNSPSDSKQMLESLGRVLDKAGMTDTVLFQGEDDKVYVASFEAVIGLANPEFVKDADVLLCSNCSYFEGGDSHNPAEIKDLLSRVEAGEEMPAGECPECGSLMHRIEQHESVKTDG
jgi:hypothetical protein